MGSAIGTWKWSKLVYMVNLKRQIVTEPLYQDLPVEVSINSFLVFS